MGLGLGLSLKTWVDEPENFAQCKEVGLALGLGLGLGLINEVRVRVRVRFRVRVRVRVCKAARRVVAWVRW